MSDKTTAVRIDKERHSEIKLYAAFKGVPISEIINNAVNLYLYESEDFREFREKYLLPEKERSITVSVKIMRSLLIQRKVKQVIRIKFDS